MERLLNAEYVAGFFDGEGCVCLFLKANGQTGLVVSIANTHIETLKLLKVQYGGTLCKRIEGRPGHWRPIGRIQWGGKTARDILVDILPHLVIKKAQVELALQFIELLFNRGKFIGWNDKKKRLELTQKVKELNHKGVIYEQ